MKTSLTTAKKTFIALAVTLVGLTATSSFASGPIAGWEDTLPVTQEETASQIETKVADLTFRDEDIYMGGQAWDYQLVDVFTYEDNDLSLTYNLKVQYRASMTLDWGKTETTRVCQSQVVVDSKLNVTVGAVECPDIAVDASVSAR